MLDIQGFPEAGVPVRTTGPTTPYGRAFLALADAVAARTALALGTAATESASAFDVSGAAAAAQAASQPVDSDLTAIAALTTTSYGRALLELADDEDARDSLGLGSAATESSSAFDVAGAAAAAQAASQPVDSDLTAIAALTTTSYGRALLSLADAAAFTALLNVFTSGLKGAVPASGGGTTNFLRADATWAAPGGTSGFLGVLYAGTYFV